MRTRASSWSSWELAGVGLMALAALIGAACFLIVHNAFELLFAAFFLCILTGVAIGLVLLVTACFKKMGQGPPG
jgi:hypothetical protein